MNDIDRDTTSHGTAPPEVLFLAGCRALAFSVTAAVAVTSPLVSLGGSSSSSSSGGGGSGGSGGEGKGRAGAGRTAAAVEEADRGDASRVRGLRLVVSALRKATGQEAGLGDMVRYIWRKGGEG